jgi:D-aspartate ligase
MIKTTSSARRAVLLGGSHGALALARSLRRAGVEVWLVTDDTSAVCFSHALRRVVRWSGANAADAVDRLEDIARAHGLHDSILLAAADPEVRLVAQARARLSRLFTVLSSDWESLRWGCDKALAYQRAAELGLGVPRVYDRGSLADPMGAQVQYPLVLKPTMRIQMNRFTADRAWRVDDRAALVNRYEAACDLVGAEHVIVQQMIPGGGESQFSYAGLWDTGQPVVSLTARRLRQYPVEFGTTSTYVQTAELPDVSAAAETFLRSIQHHGLVEMEFKRDARDGVLKLLDLNPRPWNWLGLADAAGVDFGAAIVAVAAHRKIAAVTARPGVAWMFVSRDLTAAAHSGRLRPHAIAEYAATWRRVRSLACFSWTDPLPGIVDLPLSVARALRRRATRLPPHGPAPDRSAAGK